MFAKSRSEKDAEFVRLERAMRVSGLDDKEIDNYFNDMMTEKEMHPYIEGARQQGLPQGALRPVSNRARRKASRRV